MLSIYTPVPVYPLQYYKAYSCRAGYVPLFSVRINLITNEFKVPNFMNVCKPKCRAAVFTNC